MRWEWGREREKRGWVQLENFLRNKKIQCDYYYYFLLTYLLLNSHTTITLARYCSLSLSLIRVEFSSIILNVVTTIVVAKFIISSNNV